MAALLLTAAAVLSSRQAVIKKFDSMLTSCTLSPAEISTVDDAKMRALFQGVAAAAEQPEVRNAFEIVYVDLGPVRVAGDLIFNRLQKVASSAKGSIADLEDLQTADADSLNTARELFDSVDEDASGGLKRNELLKSPVLLELLREGAVEGALKDECDALDGDCESDEGLVDAFLAVVDSDGDGEISFIEFALAVASRTGRLQLADDAVTAALDEAVRQAEMAEASSSPRKRKPRKTHAERFDEMLATAREWEEAYLCRDVSEDEIEEEGCATPEAAMDAAATAKEEGDRLRQVLLGTFAGGRSEPVANALRVCYEEYSPLRFGGDLIFRVLKKFMGRWLKK